MCIKQHSFSRILHKILLVTRFSNSNIMYPVTRRRNQSVIPKYFSLILSPNSQHLFLLSSSFLCRSSSPGSSYILPSKLSISTMTYDQLYDQLYDAVWIVFPKRVPLLLQILQGLLLSCRINNILLSTACKTMGFFWILYFFAYTSPIASSRDLPSDNDKPLWVPCKGSSNFSSAGMNLLRKHFHVSPVFMLQTTVPPLIPNSD